MTDCYLDTVEGMHYLDEDAVEHRLKRGNFNLEAKNQIFKKEPCEHNEVTEFGSEYSNHINEELELFFQTIGKYIFL